jgi:GNAT superfamily N-acetyltransferase
MNIGFVTARRNVIQGRATEDRDRGRARVSLERDDEGTRIAALVCVLARVRAADRFYPPPRVADDPAAYLAWLSERMCLARWVAFVDGTVVGHVLLATPGDHLVRFLASAQPHLPSERVVEIGRLFVDPSARHQGLGRALFDAATREAAARGLLPALVVRETGGAAMRLYNSAGWRDVGTLSARGGTLRAFLPRK